MKETETKFEKKRNREKQKTEEETKVWIEQRTKQQTIAMER